MSNLKRILAVSLCLSFLQLGSISAEASLGVVKGDSVWPVKGGSMAEGQSMIDSADSVVATDSCANVLEPQSATQDEPKLEKLVTYDPTTYQVTGFTPEGIKIIKRLRDDVRKMHKQYVRDVLNMDTIFKANLIARIMRQHVLIYGPPGAAKTMVVDYFLNRETGQIFRIQMHPMRTADSIVGGQDLNAAMSGEYFVNHKSSIIRARAAGVDELDKANPAAMTPMLELMNERRISDGLVTHPSLLETVYSTSNSNLPELLDNINTIIPGFGPAYLNRYLFKELSVNWLPHDERMILQERKNLRTRLQILAMSNPEVKENEIFETPQKTDYVELRRVADLMFDIPGTTEAVLKEFIRDVRQANIQAAKESLDAYNKDKARVGFAYIPTLDVSTRNDLLFDETIKTSALVDFLLSPLADDGNLTEYLSKGPIELDSLSIWRAYLPLTTIAPGDTRLNINLENNDDKIVSVNFGWKIDRNEASSKRDERLLEYLTQEQDRFNSKLQVDLTDYQQKLKQRAELLERLGVKRPPKGDDSFELQLDLLSR